MIIAPRPCQFCGGDYTPVRASRQYCSIKCARRGAGQKIRGLRPAAAIAARQAKTEARRTARMGVQFGALSERDRALCLEIWKRAYQVGYMVGYRKFEARR